MCVFMCVSMCTCVCSLIFVQAVVSEPGVGIEVGVSRTVRGPASQFPSTDGLHA